MAADHHHPRVAPCVSIVICTDGRAAALANTLRCLRYLDGPGFEVCVVRGPTEDGTAEVLAAWEGRIKVAQNPEHNLSVSRNVGIAMAAGEIVAFVDDDGPARARPAGADPRRLRRPAGGRRGRHRDGPHGRAGPVRGAAAGWAAPLHRRQHRLVRPGLPGAPAEPHRGTRAGGGGALRRHHRRRGAGAAVPRRAHPGHAVLPRGLLPPGRGGACARAACPSSTTPTTCRTSPRASAAPCPRAMSGRWPRASPISPRRSPGRWRGRTSRSCRSTTGRPRPGSTARWWRTTPRGSASPPSPWRCGSGWCGHGARPWRPAHMPYAAVAEAGRAPAWDRRCDLPVRWVRGRGVVELRGT